MSESALPCSRPHLHLLQQQGLQYLLLFEAVLLSAVILYGALYWLVMPLRLHDKPIFLDYSNRATTVRIISLYCLIR